MSTKYDVDYFIAKFEAIPEERWCTGALIDGQGRCCAFGHCGDREDGDIPTEANELQMLGLRHGLRFAAINDGRFAGFNQPTPKQRILAALRSLKAPTP